MTSSNILKEEKAKKRDKLLSCKLNPYPHHFSRLHFSTDISTDYQQLKAGESSSTLLQTAGRLMLMRNMGKAAFFNVQDEKGSFQCYIKLKELDPQSLQFFELVDIGDIVGVKGVVFRTKKGELTLRCKQFQIICKSLEPLPEKYHGLEDKQLQYRRRYLQLIMKPEVKEIFQIRSRIMQEIRFFLNNKGFMEVETPVLQALYGGAVAEPFTTHHRALDCKLYLKISPELYLKRLIVGGFEKVYELGKNFRNEGVDRLHSPEFTLLEYYETYTDYLYQMAQFEELVCHIVKKIKGTLNISYQGKPLNFTPPWKRLSVTDAIKQYGNFNVENKTQKELYSKIQELSKKDSTTCLLTKDSSRGEIIMALFDKIVEPHLWKPVFITDFPKEVSPLTKTHRKHKHLVERFEPFIAGMECGNAYTELNDPVEQRSRLKTQAGKRNVNNEYHHPMDEDFAGAIDVGMPPTGGVGLGVERLVLLLTNQKSLKDVILFPHFKSSPSK